MKRHLHALRQKPEHVRQRIALGTSIGITALIALIWVTTLATSGTFALAPQERNVNEAQATSGTASVSQGFTNLFGAAGAAMNPSTPTEAQLTIVDNSESSSMDRTSAPPQNASAAQTLSF